MINFNMSDSNVGGRKEKSFINHIFVIKGNYHLQNAELRSIQLWNKRYNLVFPYEANKNVKFRVKTPSGLLWGKIF